MNTNQEPPMAGDENEWVRVRRVPTPEMIAAGCRAMDVDYPAATTVYAAMLAAAPAPEDACIWTFDDDDRAPMWNSACGEAWSFTEGGPEDNNYRFCHGCGKPLAQAERQGGV